MEHILLKEDANFKNHVKKAQDSLNDGMKDKFKKLSTPYEKFKFWSENYPNFKVDRVCPNKPDLKLALELKDSGNQLFKENKHKDARKMYTKSLQVCPFNHEKPSENKDFAIILANRSATLETTGPYLEGLRDIDLAFKFGYPKEMYYKLYNRMGTIQLRLKRPLDSQQTFKTCSNWIGKSDLNDKQRDTWRNRMKKQMNVFACNKKLVNQDPPPRPLSEKLKELTPKIKLNKEKTGVISCEEILSEDLLLKETSFATVVNDTLSDEEGWICPVTYQRIFAPIPCSYGSDVVFSSLEAREIANKSFHQFEWPLIQDFKSQGLNYAARLAFRLIVGIPLKDVKTLAAEVRNSVEKEPHPEASLLSKLLSLETSTNMSLQDSTCLYLLANYFMECLRVCGYLPKESSDLTRDVAFLVARAIQVACDHSIPITVGKFVENKSELWDMTHYPCETIGQGIFPNLALLKGISMKEADKSGAGTDTIVFFQDNDVIIQSIHNILPGKTVILGPEVRGKMEKMLPQDMIPFKCNGKSCSLSFPLHEKTNQNSIQCPSDSCGTETNIWQKRRRIVEIRAQYEALRGEIEKGKARSSINFLHDLIHEWDKIVARPYKEFTKLEENLAKMLLMEHFEDEDKWIGFSSHWLRRAT